jgi:hypothetical protein
MGAGASATANNVERNVLTQFEMLLPAGSTALSLSQVLKLKPIAEANVQLNHLCVLFFIDSDMDGLFSRDELVSFVEFCSRTLNTVGRIELSLHVQGHSLLHLHNYLKTEGGVDSFCSWFVALFLEGSVKTDSQESHSDFVSRDVAHSIHQLLQIESSNGYDAQGFLDLFQRMGEEDQLMDIGREDLDDVIPVSVVKSFARHYASSVCSNMNALCGQSRGHDT